MNGDEIKEWDCIADALDLVCPSKRKGTLYPALNGLTKQAYGFSLRNQPRLVEVLLKLIPHLVIKKTQAILVADFADSRIGTVHRGWYRPYTDDQLLNHKLLKALNKKGV